MRVVVVAVVAVQALILGSVTAAAPSAPPGSIAFSLVPQVATGVGVVRPDGTGRRILTRRYSGARWSPDGKRLLAHRYAGLVVLDARGRLLESLGIGNRHFSSPEWSPSGVWIGAITERCPAGAGRDWCGDLWVLRADGRGARRLVDGGVEALGAGSLYDWSPDGHTLAHSGAPGSVLDTDPSFEGVVLVDFRTGAKTQLAALRGGAEPTWSPDGRRLAFTSPDPSGRTDLFLVARNGRGLRRLTGNGRSSGATWSPDGKRIAYLEALGDRYAVKVLEPASSVTRRVAITSDVRSQSRLAWSPDGAWLAWSDFSDRIGGDFVFVGRADGRGSPRSITEGVDPDWK